LLHFALISPLPLISGAGYLLCALIQIKIYPNAEAEKATILLRFAENNNKSGIYMWKNIINLRSCKQYIGSAVDLPNRL